MDFKKIFLKYFLFSFFIFFIIFNWSKISWLFYPTSFFRGFKYLLFYKNHSFPSFSFDSQPSFVSFEPEKFEPKREEEKNSQALQTLNENLPPKRPWTEKENSVEMPTIQVFAPLIIVKEEKEIVSALDRGVVLHPSSVSPGNEGKTIILGHSTMHRWPKSIAVWSFTYLPDLKEGDEILVNFNHLEYRYRVEKKYIILAGEDFPSIPEKENHLFLVTCWPPGRLSFNQRYIVQGKLVE